MDVYDSIVGACEDDLCAEFREHFMDRLLKHTRGFGYMCWKPQIVLQILEEMAWDDTLHWLDAGCHLNPRGRWRLKEYFSLVDAAPSGVLGFQNVPPGPPLDSDSREFPDHSDRRWTKGDLLDRLGVRDRPDILESQNIGTTTFLIRKCPQSLKFVREWLAIPWESFSFIDDTPSVAPNLADFVEHRHDQSIFSLLGKLYGIDTISVFECWYPSITDPWKPDWRKLSRYPILIKRDRGYPSPFGLRVLRIKGRLKRFFQRA
jgi:hypothetical protein